MVKASVFFENKIYVQSVELFHAAKKIIAQLNQHLDSFKYWLINPEQVRIANGVALFSYESKDARKIFSFVALIHLVIFLMLYSLSALNQRKTPDIMIELGGAPQASSGISQSATEPINPSPIKDAPKIPVEKSQVDPDVIAAQEIKRLERKKELEIERERRREIDRERQKQKERDREIELERKKELERDRQKIKELEQEKRKEQDRLKEQERQKQKELQELKQRELQEQQQQKQKEKLPEPKKLEKDGTTPVPPAQSAPPAPTTPVAPPISSPSSPSASSPSTSTPATSTLSAPASSASGPSNSISASISNAPAAAPTLDADAKAAYLTNPKPIYPFLAFKMKIEGKVILSVDVAESGAVNKVSVIESSGNESLDRSALETVKNWKFSPARKNGVIVSQVVRIPITFSLKNR